MHVHSLRFVLLKGQANAPVPTPMRQHLTHLCANTCAPTPLCQHLCANTFAPTPLRQHLCANALVPTPLYQHLRANTFAPTPTCQHPCANTSPAQERLLAWRRVYAANTKTAQKPDLRGRGRCGVWGGVCVRACVLSMLCVSC